MKRKGKYENLGTSRSALNCRKILFPLAFLILFSTARAQQTFKIIFTGDIMNHAPQLAAARTGKNTYDFSENFIYVAKILKSADFVAGNLETPLGIKPYAGYPLFSAPPSLATALKKAGFTHLMTANNHAYDKGEKGIRQTLRILDTAAMAHTGSFYHQSEKDSLPFVMLEKNGFRIALMNFTYGVNGHTRRESPLVNHIDTVKMKEQIRKAKAARPDEIIVFLHWGKEYATHPSAYQQKVENFLHRQGIRLIIGAHPHVIQPVKWQQDNLTAYSLGNFISNQRSFPRDGAFMLELILEKTGNKIRIKNVRYIPFWVYKYTIKGKPAYEILPLQYFLKDRYYFDTDAEYTKMLRFYRFVSDFMGRLSPEVPSSVPGFYSLPSSLSPRILSLSLGTLQPETKGFKLSVPVLE